MARAEPAPPSEQVKLTAIDRSRVALHAACCWRVTPMVSIRPAILDDAAAIAGVSVDSWRTACRGLVPEDYMAHLSYAETEVTWRRIIGDSEDTTTRVTQRRRG